VTVHDGQNADPAPASEGPRATAKVSAALFYAGASLGTVFVNKIVLTSYAFPSFTALACCQFVVTALVLGTLGALRVLHVRPPSAPLLRRIAPLTVLFLLNVVSGLGGTQSINLPMFTVLRRFSILFTMLGEGWIMGTAPRRVVKVSVATMLVGAVIAASADLAFDAKGYALILLNDVFTAAYGVAMKSSLSGENAVPKFELLLYNSALSAVALVCCFATFNTRELVSAVTFPGWADPSFCVLFACASVAGSVLNYSIFVCTHANSALTTTVVGCVKNVLTSYVGMVVGGDYVFSLLNFVGLNVSIGGSLLYTKAVFGG